VKRRTTTVVGGAALFALLATPGLPANAAPPSDPSPDHANEHARHKKDDRPDKLAKKHRDLRKTAFKQLVSGKAKVRERGGEKAIEVAPGQWVEYDVEDSDQILSFLVEFGGETDTKGNQKTGNGKGKVKPPTSGPVHNQIPQPDRSADNSTYWVDDFNRQHYLDMFFNGMPEQNGESFKRVYEEMSSGRYTVGGDVSDWVTVPHPESYYGVGETHEDMTYFIDDTAEAWVDAQQAAGKTSADIKDYLLQFDQWDRYDGDGDGIFEEPDGYIDHFQAIHAGEGEEAGAPEWTIWSHRWAVNQNGFHSDGIGPDGYAKFGGIEIGDTGLWIRDYTTEPENGGLGVFAHEYGHDLGLPDLYDTAGGENGTGFWTLMSSGSWLGHGQGAIGTTPNHMGAWEKLMLGWLDFETASADATSQHTLGASYHANAEGQALVVELPTGSKDVDLGIAAAEGSNYFYSGRGDDRTATVTSPTFTVDPGDTLDAEVNYAIEEDWDYAYVEISNDGGETWTPLETRRSTTTDPNGQNDGYGITGTTRGRWVRLSADLTGHEGEAQIRFRMFNDAATNELGFLVDSITVGDALVEGAEDGAGGWTMDGFSVAKSGVVTEHFDHYYIAENRVYGGYDSTLQTGPYNFGFPDKPNMVEHFPYQNGLLVTYWNTFYGDNNTSVHPGGGEILPVDANGEALRWSDGTVARNRIQAFDATFGLEPTDALSLHNGLATLNLPSRAAQPVFDDSQGTRYYDPANPGGSVQVPNTGTRIEVVSSSDGVMTLQVN
jgi:immune inhibitor A